MSYLQAIIRIEAHRQALYAYLLTERLDIHPSARRAMLSEASEELERLWQARRIEMQGKNAMKKACILALSAALLGLVVSCGVEGGIERPTPTPNIEQVYATADTRIEELQATAVTIQEQYPTPTPSP